MPMSRPSATSFASLSGKRRILLVDTYANKRDLRAKIMRKLGVEVDCAADITEARALWQADSYSLVLVDVRNDSVNVQEFCSEIRSAKPPQAVAFLVGKPEYLAGTPGADEVLVVGKNNGHDAWGQTVADRKSTRLNSSHRCISYAVFCLKYKRKSLQRSLVSNV